MPNPEKAQSLATPDPAVTGEAGAAYIASLIAAAVALFKLDLSDAQQAAAVVIIGAILTGGILLHGAIVRKGRAQGGGLVTALIQEVPVSADDRQLAMSDPGDRGTRSPGP